MTPERRKSILILTATVIIGILLGLLVPGLFHKMRGRNGANNHGNAYEHDRKSNWFSETIIRIVQPDSSQAPTVKAITQKAANQIDSIESNANRQMSILLDSVKIQLKPVLNDKQWKQLQEFDTKAKSNWHRGRRGGRGH